MSGIISFQAVIWQPEICLNTLEWNGRLETMHWLLDVHFGEDFCRVQDQNVLENLNMAHKIALNSIKLHKGKKRDKTTYFQDYV